MLDEATSPLLVAEEAGTQTASFPPMTDEMLVAQDDLDYFNAQLYKQLQQNHRMNQLGQLYSINEAQGSLQNYNTVTSSAK